ncbi:glutamine amidotransferase [Alcaligenaceae bacterium CGII-47]|nr:glutamine amidotransferase [Alcaligenaceae bacterium CGII-47]
MSLRLPLLIVQMGSPPDALREQFGDQSDWFRTAVGDAAHRIRVAHPDLGEALPDVSEFAAAVITGSWAMVTDRADWSERTGRWTKGLIEAGKPLLGVCYGHQLMADVMGGVTDYHPAGRELGTLPITLNAQGREDPWLGQLPPVFSAHLTHAQTVLVPPPGTQLLASSTHDPHQILRYGPDVLSVQFHPEFSEDLFNACVLKRESALVAEGIDLEALKSSIHETPYARQILLQFARRYAS